MDSGANEVCGDCESRRFSSFEIFQDENRRANLSNTEKSEAAEMKELFGSNRTRFVVNDET